MPLDKAIKHGKEHRKPYRGAKRYCKSCRNNGGCGWCEDNRRYQTLKALDVVKQKLKEKDENAV